MNHTQKSSCSPTIQLVSDVSESHIEKLYRDALWWQEDWDSTFISPMVQGSFLFAGAFLKGCQIGMGRAISDGVSDAYIQDIVVLKEFRCQGIGGRIVSFLVKELQQRGIDWIGLIGEPGTGSFYRELGFKEMKEFIPMRLS